jgi:hypothetical protein
MDSGSNHAEMTEAIFLPQTSVRPRRTRQRNRYGVASDFYFYSFRDCGTNTNHAQSGEFVSGYRQQASVNFNPQLHFHKPTSASREGFL